MAENETHAGTITTADKHDDFFDEPPKQNAVLTPEPQKENGEVAPEPETEPPKQNGDVPPVPQETTDPATEEADKAGGDDGDAAAAAIVVVNGVQETQEKEEEQTEGAADGVADGVQAETAADAESEEKSPEAAVQEDKPEELGFGHNDMTSNPPTPTVEPTQEVDGNAADHEGADEERPASEAQESEPMTTETKYEEEPQALEEKEEGGQEKEEEKDQGPQQSPTEQEERRTPSGGEDNYDDSFSDDTSLKNATEGQAVTTETKKEEEEVQAPVAGEVETEKEGGTGEPGTDPPRTPVSPSPSDSRAEAGVVVPVVAVTDDTKINDGRSSVTADDQGELFRGEDRKEEPAPEGSEDCRGQGQWKSEEQQYIASAILVEKGDKEALEEANKEKEKLREEFSEAKVKDLQERLAILARENEQKDKRISKLEQDMVDVTDKLRETERKLFATEKLNQQHQEAPKSKTCSIM